MEKTEALQNLFNEAQGCDTADFHRCVTRAVPLFMESESLSPIIHTLLLCNTNTFPPRVSRFLRAILEKVQTANPDYLPAIFSHLISFCSSRSTKARKHALQLLHMIVSLHKIKLDTELLQTLAERLFDREASVRREALKLAIIYQNSFVADGLKIQTTLKDVLRYDSSADIRRSALVGIEVDSSTLNSVLERALDVSGAIRKTFWLVVLHKIDFTKVPHHQRTFILQTAFSEREFDAWTPFLSHFQRQPAEAVAEIFYCDLAAYDALIEALLSYSWSRPPLDASSAALVHLLKTYYRKSEERDGRDALRLYPLADVLAHITQKCTEEESEGESCLSEDTASSDVGGSREEPQSSGCTKGSAVIVELLGLLHFYDIFCGDDRKLVLRTIKKLLMKYSSREVVEECVLLAKVVCSSRDLTQFLGTIIKKNMGERLSSSRCRAICDSVMKHVPFSELHEAIYGEIALANPEEFLNVIFWYALHKQQDEVIEMYLGFLPRVQVIEGATDLVIKGVAEYRRLRDFLISSISDGDNSSAVIIPVAKLLLAAKVYSEDELFFLEQLLVFYYSALEQNIQQFLSIFFAEYASKKPDAFVLLFCPVLEKIRANHRVFIDQVLFWLRRPNPEVLQKLYYTICLYVQKNYDTLKNKKCMFAVLDAIDVSDSWDKGILKKAIALLSLIIKRRPKENAQLLLGKLVAVDDGVPISPEEYRSLMADIECEQ